ncbi:hypothetical protein FRC0457_02140 [Corynebacterium diphtheriae]|nr:hypothetical protein FRC0285_01946 [Corynebacterium diphtheriae]CAB0972339.1 hypothetical protein FRC0457_02140 [Corynebacterium diphtheriae]
MAQDTRVLSFAGIKVSKPSTQNQGPTVQPNRNAIVDTICRTTELGETTTKATEHGDSYRHRSRAHRAHQRIPRMQAAKKTMSAPQRHPRLLRPLHIAVPDPRRQHPTHNQCTLKPEEPPNGGISKDFSRHFTPNRKKTGRLSRFGVKCRLFRG